MTYERQMLLQHLIDTIDDAAIHDREVRPLDLHPDLFQDLFAAIDRSAVKADGRPVRYMPIHEAE